MPETKARDKKAADAAKAFLSEIEDMDDAIDSMMEQSAHLNAMRLKITATMRTDGAGGGGGEKDKIGALTVRLVALEDEIDKKIDAYVDRKRRAIAIIEKVENRDRRKLLRKKYLVYIKNWDELALEMHCGKRNAQYIHGDALLDVAAIMREEGLLCDE